MQLFLADKLVYFYVGKSIDNEVHKRKQEEEKGEIKEEKQEQI